MRQLLRRRPSLASLDFRSLGAEQLITFGIVTAAVVFVFSQLHPELIFANTTPAGGDMGAHVWGPAFMRDHLIPNFRLTGWAPDWYDGFPAFWFYFPLPSLAIVILDVILPYGVAFKLVTILGLLALPVCAWAFGKLMGMRFPGPPILAVATVPFLFDRYFTIYGGNIASTLAGEFSFAISLSLSLLFLGFVARGLDTGKHRGTAACLLAATGLCHLLPTIFAIVGALVLLMLRPGKSRAKFLATILGVGAMLAAFWSLPFLFRLPYVNNMGWEKLTTYSKELFRWQNPNSLRLIVMLALAGAIVSIMFRRRTGLFLFAMAAIAAALFVFAPQARLWNARILPFWYLSLYLLAGVAISEAGIAISQLIAADPLQPSLRMLRAAPILAAVAVWMGVGLPLGAIPDFVPHPQTTDQSFIPSWAKWNYSGYERKDAYPEYKSVIDLMRQVGKDYGCGRTHWEYESGQDRFGTPMALMLLPFWTDGCIGSMEGLYFESSATTPYHFLDAGELSKAPSNPQRDLPYRALDINSGIEHLQMMGTRYYLAFSAEAIAQASVNPNLRQISQTADGKWKVYEVAGSELVVPLAFEPAVVEGVQTRGERPWLDMSVNWYMDESAHDVYLAADGPKDWPRVKLDQIPTAVATIGSGVKVETPAKVPTSGTGVKNIKSTDNSISFDVDKAGSPVLVKASYFPNWKVQGGKGPYRVTPNLMVVIPTSTHVKMHFGWTGVDIMAWLITFGGIAAVVWFVRRGPVDLDAEAEKAVGDGEDAPVEQKPRQPEPAGAGGRVDLGKEAVTARNPGGT